MLPAVSIKKYANPMGLLKVDMPIGYKDPIKDVDDGMASGYSESKEPGEEGEDRHHSEEDEQLAQNWLCLRSREDTLSTLTVTARSSHCPPLPNPRALPANRTRSTHPHYLFLLLELLFFLIPSAT